jgi:hypothetical protein
MGTTVRTLRLWGFRTLPNTGLTVLRHSNAFAMPKCPELQTSAKKFDLYTGQTPYLSSCASGIALLARVLAQICFKGCDFPYRQHR